MSFQRIFKRVPHLFSSKAALDTFKRNTKGPPFKTLKNAGAYISHNATASLFKSKPSALNFQPQNCVKPGALPSGWVEREPPHTSTRRCPSCDPSHVLPAALLTLQEPPNMADAALPSGHGLADSHSSHCVSCTPTSAFFFFFFRALSFQIPASQPVFNPPPSVKA